MRHTFATPRLDYGNDLKTVQALMGHSHIRTTDRYLHSTDDRKVEAIQSLQFGVRSEFEGKPPCFEDNVSPEDFLNSTVDIFCQMM